MSDRLERMRESMPALEVPEPQPEPVPAPPPQPVETIIALNSVMHVISSQPGIEYQTLCASHDPQMLRLASGIGEQARRMAVVGVTFSWTDWKSMSPLDRSVIYEAYNGRQNAVASLHRGDGAAGAGDS